jgi:hypothetical protein
MKAHQLFLRGVGIALRGSPLEDVGSESHPAFEARLDRLAAWYIENHPNPEEAKGDLRGMRFPADTAELLWERVKPGLLAEYRSGRQMAPIWRPT